VNTDLVSYSSYETINVGRQNLRDQILHDVGFIRSFPGLNGRQLFIAEFGWDNYMTGLDADMRADIASQAFFDAGATRTLYWALYDNGSGQSLIDSSGNTTPVGNTVKGIVNSNKGTTLPAPHPVPAIAGKSLTPSSVIELAGTGSASQVNWAIAGQGAGPAVSGHALAHTQQLMPYSGPGMIRVETREPQLDLGPLGLTPGPYHILAYTVGSGGNVSAPTSFDIVLVQTSEASAAGVRVFPNPWKATTANKKEVTLDGLTGHSTIKFFTLSGRSVRVLTTDANSIGWDLRNEEGDDVASGIYIYNITNDQSQHLRGQLVLIR
jgi:hypothetical protein